jgi:hypothetical protein
VKAPSSSILCQTWEFVVVCEVAEQFLCSVTKLQTRFTRVIGPGRLFASVGSFFDYFDAIQL